MASPQIDLDRDQILLGDLSNFARLRNIANPTQDEVRLHAAAVRKLLLDGVLPAAAGSRRMPVAFHVPDSLPLVRAARNNHVVGFNLAGLEVFGIEIAGGAISRGTVAAAKDFNPSRLIPLKLDSFLKQTVAFSGGELLSRHDVIVYVANKVGGVHYDPKASNAMPQSKIRALGQLRRSLRMGIHGSTTSIQFAVQQNEDHDLAPVCWSS
ncbi:MAG: hypothetical protein EPN79_01100 [Burkholderiaceae bacterium]|nr:MAG: hypothetical protein EPN79_01100 [Burkholderiaceae bacterium]TBR76106.1 MAG: hypothetical protein EPN64_09365 [Burkholderiaceae bacterium]